jgi:hypothetical protein
MAADGSQFARHDMAYGIMDADEFASELQGGSALKARLD